MFESDESPIDLIRFIGYVIGVLAVISILFTLFFLWQALLWTMQQSINWAPLIIWAILALIALWACILSRRRARLAGIMLIVIAVILGTWAGIEIERQYIIYVLALDLPLFFAGVLFLFSWWRSRKT